MKTSLHLSQHLNEIARRSSDGNDNDDGDVWWPPRIRRRMLQMMMMMFGHGALQFESACALNAFRFH